MFSRTGLNYKSDLNDIKIYLTAVVDVTIWSKNNNTEKRQC